MLQLTVDKAQTLKEFTENNCAQASFYWTYLLKNKDIKVNGERVKGDVQLAIGDTVCYYLTPKQEEKPVFHLVYEDENILIVDKESGVNSEAVYADLARKRICYFIHRLDRNTKGLLVFALTEQAEKVLLSAFRERKVENVYHALCFGMPEKEKAVLTAYWKKDESRSLVKIFDKPRDGAEKIVTEYKILCQENGLTKLEVILHTGKTHQIRAHLAHIGCPIVGDMKYGKTEENKRFSSSRQCLVAKRLKLFLDGEFSYLAEKEFFSRFQAELQK